MNIYVILNKAQRSENVYCAAIRITNNSLLITL
jgi:hypothetical protein